MSCACWTDFQKWRSKETMIGWANKAVRKKSVATRPSLDSRDSSESEKLWRKCKHRKNSLCSFFSNDSRHREPWYVQSRRKAIRVLLRSSNDGLKDVLTSMEGPPYHRHVPVISVSFQVGGIIFLFPVSFLQRPELPISRTVQYEKIANSRRRVFGRYNNVTTRTITARSCSLGVNMNHSKTIG